MLTKFYDSRIITEAKMSNEPRESVHDENLHFMTVDNDGKLLAYITLKQPPEIDGTLLYRHRDRPLFPCEEVHGRAWQNSLLGVDEIALPTCWEFGRFVKDQRRGSQAIAHRAALELGLNAGRLLRHPRQSLRLRR